MIACMRAIVIAITFYCVQACLHANAQECLLASGLFASMHFCLQA
jgi:hypothetical protein